MVVFVLGSGLLCVHKKLKSPFCGTYTLFLISRCDIIILCFGDASFSTLRLKLSVIRSLFSWVDCIPNADIPFVGMLLYRFYGYA